MRTRVVKRGKKITAVILAVAMILPLTWSQTVVTKAEDVTSTPAESQLVYLDATDKKPEIEPNKEIKVDIKAKEAMKLNQIDGYLTFSSSAYTDNQLLECFSIKSVLDPDGDTYSPAEVTENKGYRINIHDSYSKGKTFAKDATIATITLEVSKSIDDVTVKLNNMQVSAKLSGAADDTEEPNSWTTVPLTNKLAGQHKVVLEMPQGLEGKVSNEYTPELIEVPIRIQDQGNTGFCGIQILFTYESDKLQFINYQLSPKAAKYLKVETGNPNPNYNLSHNAVLLAFAGEKDTDFTGDFLTLRFKSILNESEVKNGRTVDTTITPEIVEVNNVSGMTIGKGDMKGEFASGKETSKITLKQGWQLGDINKDGRINLLDVTWALQAYNGIRVLTSEQITLGDVNGDKKVSLVDAILILRYVNEEITAFTPKK